MATLTIRNLPESVRRSLKERAAAHNRSMEAEVRSILEEVVTPRADFVGEWLTATEPLRGTFIVPERTAARPVDLS
ncbi:FitA-like ribbon-helix-helix domain-containing protein [Microcella sp.]|uniref:FitA-like ribbon-helix-helix domain-containing protein n=1 Tax=Microcella sp. TaxID=1913979 RepID=UPI002563E90E|nr:Arc family DNA-binding protein [Microcella sp.]MBX9471508.1 Arc family DNA-binding protein [Microcella sp.]